MAVASEGVRLRQRDDLLARYSEPERHYHTRQHLAECLAEFECSSHLALRPAEVEAGLWFHDAVYDPHRNDNEERSAALAREVLAGAGVAADAVARVADAIMAANDAALTQTYAEIKRDLR